MKTKITKEIKIKLLNAIAKGEFDTAAFPELVDLIDRYHLHPDLSRLTDQELKTYHALLLKMDDGAEK